jgi:hypothetical protein
LRLALTEPVTNVVVRLPDGALRAVRVDPEAREWVYGETGRQGIYGVEAGTNRVTYCVNLLDALETDTTPKSELRFGKYTRVQASTVKRASLEFWRWIAAAGLAVLLFEWWYFHRRTA